MYDPERSFRNEQRIKEMWADHEAVALRYGDRDPTYVRWSQVLTEAIEQLSHIEEDIRSNCFDPEKEEKLRQDWHELNDLIDKTLTAEEKRRGLKRDFQ